jgi:hypothetical protein
MSSWSLLSGCDSMLYSQKLTALLVVTPLCSAAATALLLLPVRM